jgi:hypothetical protein
MLAADLGMNEVTHDHPDKNNFLPKQFDDARAFDIVLCDGQVLRTHERAAYREQCEARRLAVSQLVHGLEHLRPSGTMIILMHKLEAPAVVEILHQFHRFSSIQLFKSTKAHAKRSSFYLVASNIQVEHPQAIAAVEKWKRTWEITTFNNNEENIEHLHRDSSWAIKNPGGLWSSPCRRGKDRRLGCSGQGSCRSTVYCRESKAAAIIWTVGLGSQVLKSSCRNCRPSLRWLLGSFFGGRIANT